MPDVNSLEPDVSVTEACEQGGKSVRKKWWFSKGILPKMALN